MSAAAGGEHRQVRHGRRIALIWFVLAAIATPVVYFVWGPHMPPGTMSTAADSQRFDNQVLGAIATPVVLFIWVYVGYALVFFRQRGPEVVDGPPLRTHRVAVLSWISLTSAIVLFAFGFGTYELIAPAGAGAGEGPRPIWTPGGRAPLQVQVIAQQWRFTYRWPEFGDVETFSLQLPVHTEIRFDVTSLDVIHSFWAYQLGVKADANPGVDNVAYTEARRTGAFQVRCSELCGIWHGAMTDQGDRVVTTAAFMSWIHQQQVANAGISRFLPAFALTYSPDDFGAAGGYYPPEDPSSTKYP